MTTGSSVLRFNAAEFRGSQSEGVGPGDLSSYPDGVWVGDVTNITRFLVCTLMGKEMVPRLPTKTLATGHTLRGPGKGLILVESAGARAHAHPSV